MISLPFLSRGRSRATSVSGILLALTLPLATPVHAQTTSNPPPTPNWAVTGDLLELMRGLYFPAANMIFNVQTADPAQKKPVAGDTASGGAGFDFVQWGAGLYEGWEYVDYAAAMLAESSPLLLTPGRLCSNGKPMPVDRPDWVQYTNEMLVAARKSYKLSKARNQEAVADSTNDLTEACLSCHRVYRDRRAPGATGINDPRSLALRCTAP